MSASGELAVSAERLELMQQNWAAQLARVGVPAADAYPLFDELVVRYREPQRHYHNLEHVAEVLKVIGKLGDLAENPVHLYLAAWYHDAVYDPPAKDNEEISARLAVERLSALNVRDTERIAEMIRATAHTEAPPVDDDTCILLDADLAILGAEPARYARYAEAIRREYSCVDDAAYRTGRSRVLEAFLRRERIYRTERMFAVGEQAARENLKSELKALEK